MEPTTTQLTEVSGFPVDLARAYDPDTHLWVHHLGSSAAPGGGAGDPADAAMSRQAKSQRYRVGLDALGVETSGTLASLAFMETGTELLRGEPFGSLEAAKFVGPFLAPVPGRLAAVNEAVLADPSLVERDPYGDGWLVEFEAAESGEIPGALVRGADGVAEWFAAAVEDYRLKGVLAE